MLIKLELTVEERNKLRRNKVKLSSIQYYTNEELAEMLSIDVLRAKTLIAHAQFQQIPSIGPQFVKSLTLLELYSLTELQEKDGAKLIDQYEQKCGFSVDPCVEDQFRLAVHYANNPETEKKWWDFTDERKAYRTAHGYPANRPQQKSD